MIERKTFTYDGMNSADFGLYIAGDSVYDAPTRDMDMITIPGRNGQLSIDQGRFENITVTYPCFIWADTQAEFRQKVRAIRNWLCAKHSYYRLTDEYNPESFRLGIYKSGLEVDPIFYNRAGRFELSFDCKPQRFLFSGEEVFTLGQWGETETKSGSIVSFDGTETTAIKSLKVNIVPNQSGTGDPSPSNVRPISGWDEVNSYVAGGNIFDKNLYPFLHDESNNGWYISGTRLYKGGVSNATIGMPCKPNTKYKISFTIGYALARIAYGKMADLSFQTGSTNQYIYNTQADTTTVGYREVIYQTGADATFLFIQFPYGYHTEGADSLIVEEIANTYTTSLPQTVYGGVLDVVSGKLTLTKSVRTISGTDVISAYSEGTGFWRVNVSATQIPTTAYPEILANKYIGRTSYNAIGNTDNSVGINNATFSQFLLKDTTLTTVDGLKSALNTTPLVICYPLATPTEIQLTPTEVKTLLGNNNIWADAGTVEVEIGENPNILVNPTPFESCPVFEVEGSGTLTVNNSSMTIVNNGTTIIDSEMMEAYEEENGAIISRNDSVSGEFPKLESGNNNIETVGLTSVKVTPKWYEV